MPRMLAFCVALLVATPAETQTDIPPEEGGRIKSLGLPPIFSGDAFVSVGKYGRGEQNELAGYLNLSVKKTFANLGLDLELPGGTLLAKHRVYGFGPELTLPIATKEKLYALLNVRYFWEIGARTMLEGSTLLVTASLPIPSISLQ